MTRKELAEPSNDRFQTAFDNAKWWSELVGILVSWSAVIVITAYISRMEQPFNGQTVSIYNLFLQLSLLTFMFVYLFVLLFFSYRVFLLFYHFIDQLNEAGSTGLRRVGAVVFSAVVTASLFFGTYVVVGVVAFDQAGAFAGNR